MKYLKSMRVLLILCLALISACSYPPLDDDAKKMMSDYSYQIGPGDVLEIFVWDNPDISSKISVRPDGKITTPLAEDLLVSGKSPNQVARELEKSYETFIRNPQVVVMVTEFQGVDSQQIRIVGQIDSGEGGSSSSRSSGGGSSSGSGSSSSGGSGGSSSSRYSGMTIPYERGMSLLDVVIRIGRIGEFADGNRAVIVRTVNGVQKKFGVKIDDLVEDADMSKNVAMHPGDILVIPEAFF